MTTDQSRHLPDMSSRRGCLAAALGWTLMLAAGCATKEKEIITQVTLHLVAGADVNPDAAGRASPLLVRLYALKSPSAFTSADFFSLFDKDSATLGADLVQREEVPLHPGETRTLALQLKAEVKALGVLAAYRDLKYAHWRELHMLKVGQTYPLKLLFGARQIQMT